MKDETKEMTQEKRSFWRVAIFVSTIAIGFMAFGSSVSIGVAGLVAHENNPNAFPIWAAGLSMGLLLHAFLTLAALFVGFYRRDFLIQFFALFSALFLWPSFATVSYFLALLSSIAQASQ